MKVEILPDAAGVGARAADIVCAAARVQPRARLGLPTGATPLTMYEELNRRSTAGACDLNATVVYAIDEFVGPSREARGTNTHFYRSRISFRPRAVHCPNPSVADPALHIRAYAEAIQRAGGFDLCVLGIGANGHIAFNEPPATASSRARVVSLDQASRSAHADAFGGLARVPAEGMTLGIADLLASRAILVLARGGHKAVIVRKAIEEAPSEAVPASWLQFHDDVTWVVDTAAAGALGRRQDD